ncbi:hypothetical protein [Neisseria iguanae]|nr:hypothetical protein [Neisseria iguanae]
MEKPATPQKRITFKSLCGLTVSPNGSTLFAGVPNPEKETIMLLFH